jgi:hypothetical protein
MAAGRGGAGLSVAITCCDFVTVVGSIVIRFLEAEGALSRAVQLMALRRKPPENAIAC